VGADAAEQGMEQNEYERTVRSRGWNEKKQKLSSVPKRRLFLPKKFFQLTRAVHPSKK